MKLIPTIPKDGILSPEKLFVGLSNGVRDMAVESVRFMSTYPPKRGASRYRRTGTLRNSWSFSIKSGGKRIEGSVNSNSGIAPYNEEVQGENQDALFSMIGWKNVNDLQKKVDREFQGRLGRIIGGLV